MNQSNKALRADTDYIDPRTLETKVNGILVNLVSSYIRNGSYADYDEANRQIRVLVTNHIKELPSMRVEEYTGVGTRDKDILVRNELRHQLLKEIEGAE